MQAHQAPPLTDVHMEALLDTKFPYQGDEVNTMNAATSHKRLGLLSEFITEPSDELGAHVVANHRVVHHAAFGGKGLTIVISRLQIYYISYFIPFAVCL